MKERKRKRKSPLCRSFWLQDIAFVKTLRIFLVRSGYWQKMFDSTNFYLFYIGLNWFSLGILNHRPPYCACAWRNRKLLKNVYLFFIGFFGFNLFRSFWYYSIANELRRFFLLKYSKIVTNWQYLLMFPPLALITCFHMFFLFFHNLPVLFEYFTTLFLNHLHEATETWIIWNRFQCFWMIVLFDWFFFCSAFDWSRVWIIWLNKKKQYNDLWNL